MIKILFLIWLAAMAVDTVLPFCLKPFYKGYSHKKHVLSLLGCRQSPAKRIYNPWCIVSGIIFCVAGYCFYSYYGNGLSVAIWVMLAMYGFGCETMSGIFPIENSPEAVTLSSKLHGAGSAIGCTVFLFVPLLLGVAQFPNRRAYGIVCIVCFILAVVFIVFFVMGEKKRFRNTVFALTGLWQRLLLYVCYLPLTLFGILLFA